LFARTKQESVLIVKVSSFWAEAVSDGRKLLRICLSYRKDDFQSIYKLNFEKKKRLPPLLQRLKCDLIIYGSGSKVDFSCYPLQTEGYSSFTRRVWAEVREIPYGRFCSYKWIAQRLNNRGYRAIGKALSINPFPIIIPCHRVIREDGSLGGYSQGMRIKKELLRIEGVLPLLPQAKMI